MAKVKIKYYEPVINAPDYQGRMYRNKKGIEWVGKVHEKIVGNQYHTFMPTDNDFCILHDKTIQRQEKQNSFYNKILTNVK